MSSKFLAFTSFFLHVLSSVVEGIVIFNAVDGPDSGVVTGIDSDYGGASLDRKSTTGGCQFLGRRLISWQCKKQTIVENSTSEAEYVAPDNCYGQVLWIQNQMIMMFELSATPCNAVWFVFEGSSYGTKLYLHRSSIPMLSLYITAKVAGKPVNISEESIRSDLLFDDADGIDSLHNQAIFDVIQLMGYEGDLTVLTFNKAMFSSQWRFLFHTMNHCISSKSTSWDQIPTNIATAVICLATNQRYNFSKLIFDGMMRHLDANKKFVMYPRFISVFLTNQLKNVPIPLDHFPINALTTKVFSFMVKKGKSFSGNVTPLFPSMLAQPTKDEGAVSERPSETQPTPSPPHLSADQHEIQPNPSPRPSPTIPILDSIPEESGGNHGGQSSSDRSLSRNEDGLTLQSVYDLCVSLCKQVTTQDAQIKDLKSQIKQLKKKAKLVISHHNAWIKSGRKSAKSTPTAHTDQVFDDVDVNDAMDYMETDAYMQKGVSTEDQVSTVKPDEGTDKPKVSTDKPEVSTAEPKDGTSDESTAPTTVFRDDETIAEFLVSMSQNKAKQKGVEIKDAEDSDRPRATSTRSVLTLKPLPKIDPKDKGKKVLEEEAESDAESEGVDEAERKFDQLAKDEEIARKVQEDWEAEEEMKKLVEEEDTKAALIQDFDDIQARIEADRLLAARLQEEERETFTVEERAKFLYDTIAAQRRFLAQQRAAAIRSRPPTRTQLRNQMMTYLKHAGGKNHTDLKNKNFEEIQVLYKKVKRSDKNFIAIGSAKDERQIKEMNKESKDPKKKRLKKRVVNETLREEDTSKVPAEQEVTERGTKKRKSGHVKMIARKRPRPQPDDDSDNEHRKCLRIVTFDSTLDSEIMETKSFQYSKITPEGIEMILWGDLKIMIESSTEENDQALLSKSKTAFGNDKSNRLIVDSLLKTIRLSIHLVVYNEELAIPEQTATGKGISNPLMAGSLPKTTKPT
ncbi:hypothetical protein Tco_1086277 [Tanacetum coccineum]